MRTAIENIDNPGTQVTDDPRQHILHFSRHGGPADVVKHIENCFRRTGKERGGSIARRRSTTSCECWMRGQRTDFRR